MKFGTLRFKAEPDVNTTAGFTRALVTAADGELTDEQAAAIAATPDRSIASGLEESPEPTAPARDDQGRFAPAPAAQVEEEEQGAAPESEAPTKEPNREQYEAGYAKALGEASERIGAERQAREALEARLAALEAERQEEEVVPASQDDIDRIERMFEEVGGPAAMATVARDMPHLVEDALDIWYEYDPRTARKYERQVNRMIAETQEESAPAPVALQLPPEVQGLVVNQRLTGLAGEMLSELGEAEAKRIAPHIDKATSDAPEIVKTAIGTALNSEDPEQQRQGVRAMIELARPYADGTATATAQQQHKGETRAQKIAAGVATGSASPVTSGESGVKNREEFEALSPDQRKQVATKLVAESFKKTEDTSVAAGLTYGPTP